MGLLWQILTLPYAPVRAVTAVARVLQQRVEEELYSPASVRRELEELDRAVARGELTEDERQAAEQEVLDRLMNRPAA